jgi:hypothetical protein
VGIRGEKRGFVSGHRFGIRNSMKEVISCGEKA